MQLLNVRINHATNSSSSHSVIMAGTAKGDPEIGSFGWENFCQRTYGQKMLYMASQLYSQMQYELGEPIAAAVAKSLFGEFVEDGFGYVDHQSEITVPSDFKGHSAIEFYKELAESLASDKAAHIRGGNDNSEYPDGYQGTDNERWGWLSSLKERGRNAAIVRKQNGVWTLYNRGDGVKLHLNFSKENILQEKYRPLTPELVDLKITDYCPFGCTWCYQDSTVHGKHAKMDVISSMIYQLQNAEVFEVALGGGEPTMHPDFPQILKEFREHGITPNFTTKSLVWYDDTKILDAVKENVGAVAHSVTSADEVRKVLKKREEAKLGYGGARLVFQYILDAYSMENFVEVMKTLPEYGSSITLLGYKSNGRGGKRPYTNKGWLAAIKTLNMHATIAIDTLLASQYEDELVEHEISPKLYYKEEGRFSMYMDAVAQKYAQSSFVDESEYKLLNSIPKALEDFSSWKLKSMMRDSCLIQ